MNGFGTTWVRYYYLWNGTSRHELKTLYAQIIQILIQTIKKGVLKGTNTLCISFSMLEVCLGYFLSRNVQPLFDLNGFKKNRKNFNSQKIESVGPVEQLINLVWPKGSLPHITHFGLTRYLNPSYWDRKKGVWYLLLKPNVTFENHHEKVGEGPLLAV